MYIYIYICTYTYSTRLCFSDLPNISLRTLGAPRLKRRRRKTSNSAGDMAARAPTRGLAGSFYAKTIHYEAFAGVSMYEHIYGCIYMYLEFNIFTYIHIYKCICLYKDMYKSL